MSIGENIRALREAKNMSQKELAEVAGVTDKAVSTWELNISVPRMGAIQKIADYFKVSKSRIIEEKSDYLLGRSEPKTPPAETEGLDDFTYAMHNETKELTDEDKKFLLEMVKRMKEKIQEKK